MRDRARAHYRRTRPNCHICGRPIDWEADYKDPQAFVVDHVIPLTKGGEDALHNMRAAHRHMPGLTPTSRPRDRECNSKKRARDHAPIIRRSGTLNR